LTRSDLSGFPGQEGAKCHDKALDDVQRTREVNSVGGRTVVDLRDEDGIGVGDFLEAKERICMCICLQDC
jgi:hypothetical protein